jgi:hypothetical protein
MDMMNFQSLPRVEEAEEVGPTIRPVIVQAPKQAPVGRVLEIGGGGAKVELDLGRLSEVSKDPDPSIALSGQVGGHVKIEIGPRWVLASVRTLKLSGGEGGVVHAEVDFLG